MSDQQQLESAMGWASEVFDGHIPESHTKGFKAFFSSPKTVLSYVCYVGREYPDLTVDSDENCVEVLIPNGK